MTTSMPSSTDFRKTRKTISWRRQVRCSSRDPRPGAPHVDSLAGSKHANMKELRFTAHEGREVWRAAFAFDSARQAIVLVAGEKQGVSQALFYKRLIKIADARFDLHLHEVKSGRRHKG